MSAAHQVAYADLSVPVLPDDVDVLTAALAYAAAGWYLVPVRRGTKHPGSVLGDGWPALSSRDREVIVSWYAGTNYGIALHVGRSGAVVFDIDHPEQAPITLDRAERECRPPTQRTRADQRRHLVFAVPDGRTLSNQRGKLGYGWGEVRGTNGVIIVAPSVHPEGGHYRWTATGRVPVLPAGVADMLPDAGPGEAAADAADVAEFARRHTTGNGSAFIGGVLSQFTARVEQGASRHEALVSAACWAAREAQAGCYPAAEARKQLREAFIAAMAEGRGGARVISPGEARMEFDGMWAWAVGQALGKAAEEEAVDSDVAAPSASGDTDSESAETDSVEELTLEEIARRKHARLVAEELEKLEVREEARRIFDERKQADRPSIAEGVIDDLDSIEAPAMLVGGLIPELCVGWLAGRSGAYKSFLATAWGCCIATGRPWLGRPEFAVRRALRVLYVAAEGAAGAAGRIRAWEQANSASRKGRLLLYPRPIHLNDQGRAAELANYVATNGIEFLIIDTFRRSAPGVEDNSTTEVGLIFEAVAGIRDDHSCGVLMLDHTGHAGERLRGASGKGDDGDYVLKAGYEGESRAAHVQRRLSVLKLKDWESDAEWPIVLDEVAGQHFPVATIGEVRGARVDPDDWSDQLKWALPGDVMTLEPKADKDGRVRGREAVAPLAMFMRQHAPKVDGAVGISRVEAVKEIVRVAGHGERSIRNAWSALIESGRLSAATGVRAPTGRHVWVAIEGDPKPVDHDPRMIFG